MTRCHPRRTISLLGLCLTGALVAGLVGLTGCGGGAAPTDTSPLQTETPPDPAIAPIPQQHAPRHVLVRPSTSMALGHALNDLGGTQLRRVGQTDFYVVRVPDGESTDAFLERLRKDVRVVDSTKDRFVSHPEGGGATIPIAASSSQFTTSTTNRSSCGSGPTWRDPGRRAAVCASP